METKLKYILSLLVMVSGSAACASVQHVDALYDPTGSIEIKIEDALKDVGAGSVVIVSEQHGNQKHYENQKIALKELARKSSCTLSVGLEFLTYTDQKAIDDYFDGRMTEADFLTAIKWSGNPFSDYRDQALAPKVSGGRLIGINSPRSLTGQIAKAGLVSLSPADQNLLPPGLQMGRASYRERFEVVMGGHIKPDQVQRYFEAQSVWDDTMAWQAESFLKAHPDHCLAIVVGDFHAQYGGGLPDRLKARGVKSVTVISQVEARDLTGSELDDEVLPSPKYGARGDAIWVTNSP